MLTGPTQPLCRGGEQAQRTWKYPDLGYNYYIEHRYENILQQADTSFNARNPRGVSFEMSQSCVGGFAPGEHVQVSRPPVDTAFLPQSIRKKIQAGCYIDLTLVSKLARGLRTDAHTTEEIVIKMGNLLYILYKVGQLHLPFIYPYIFKNFQTKPT